MTEHVSGTTISGLLATNNKSRKGLCSTWPALTPVIFILLCKAIASGSRKSAKMRGDRGELWQVPWLHLKEEDIIPLVRTVAWGSAYIHLTHCLNNGPNPNLSNVKNRHLGIQREGDYRIYIISHFPHNMQQSSYVIRRVSSFLTNPTWSGWTREGITFSSLVANIFANIFSSTFIREIGR